MLALKPLTAQCLWHAARCTGPYQSRSLHWAGNWEGHRKERALNPRQQTPSFDELDPGQRRKAAGRKRSRDASAIESRSRRPSLLEELKPDEIQRAAEGKAHRKDRNRRPRPPQLSLLEELFPDEAYNTNGNSVNAQRTERELPRIPLPEVDELFGDFQDDLGLHRRQPSRVTKEAAADAFRRQQLAVVTLQIASKSLVESDFRRLAPKGKHIDEWTGPGDILKVIPAREPSTFEQIGHYFILFPNPAYARTYQSHVVHLHRMARTHTPTSIESPLPLQPGVSIQGEDAYTLLQDYALCPPSQRMQLKLLYPSYSPGTRHLLNERGYRQLVENHDIAGKSVLFWIVGSQLTTHSVRNAISTDGRHRGLAWDVTVEQMDTSASTKNELESSEGNGEADESDELTPQQTNTKRWILSFSDESEARRFIRAWHRRQFPQDRGEDPRLVHAEFLW